MITFALVFDWPTTFILVQPLSGFLINTNLEVFYFGNLRFVFLVSEII
jgi:hypothetical protein